MRKLLLFIFFIVLVVYLLYKSPFSALYNYNKARDLYNQGRYEQSLPYFEKSLFADSKGILARFFYVMALSKSEPTYSVQKKLYDMSESKIVDEASKFAKSQIVYLKRNLLEGIDSNYIYTASMGNDILHWDIRSFPLKVYIEKTPDVPSYYYEMIDLAMNQWVLATNFVKFDKVDNIENANIVIKFKDINSERCEDKNSCKYVVAYTEPEVDKNKILKKMVLTFYKTNPRKETFSKTEIYNTALHETGHTLGIMGHSDKPGDIMYAIKEDESIFMPSSQTRLSARDLKTLVLLYRFEPTISNIKNSYSESFYYPPLILGSDDLRLQKKIEELTKYIKDYPNMPAGYINISSVYADMGDYDAALKNLSIADGLNLTDDEKYISAYNRAIIYFNKQEPDKALEYANQAKSIKDDENTRELIEDIQKMR